MSIGRRIQLAIFYDAVRGASYTGRSAYGEADNADVVGDDLPGNRMGDWSAVDSQDGHDAEQESGRSHVLQRHHGGGSRSNGAAQHAELANFTQSDSYDSLSVEAFD